MPVKNKQNPKEKTKYTAEATTKEKIKSGAQEKQKPNPDDSNVKISPTSNLEGSGGDFDAFDETQQIEDARAKDEKVYQDLYNEAGDMYKVGRDGIRRALALALILYKTADADEDVGKDFLAIKFDGLSVKGKLGPYTQITRCCFDVNAKTQAPTISKYAHVLRFIELKFTAESVPAVDYSQIKDPSMAAAKKGAAKGTEFAGTKIENSPECIQAVLDLIESYHGLDACARHVDKDGLLIEPKESKEPKEGKKTKRLNQDELNNKLEGYKLIPELGSFSPRDPVPPTECSLVVMIGRLNGPNVEVVDIMAIDELVDDVIRLHHSTTG